MRKARRRAKSNLGARPAAAEPDSRSRRRGVGHAGRTVLMRIALGIIVGFLVGGFAGYMLGIYVACAIFEAGNLCGLVGVFITGPLGALAGSIAGGLLCQRRP